MIKNFNNVFSYVNERYVFNAENYPVMANLTEQQQMIFALKHGLLHMLKSVNKIGYEIPQERKDIKKLSFLAAPDEALGENAVVFKTALLKTIVNIVSITNTVGFNLHAINYFTRPSDEEMTTVISVDNLGGSILVTFKAAVDFFIEKLAGILEKADHEDVINIEEVRDLITDLYRIMKYWFDDFWVPGFLTQIPNVMKSK